MKVSIVTRLVVSFLVACGGCQLESAQASSLSRVNVHLVTDEAEAVLSILAKRMTNEPIIVAEWQRLFQSEGYTRLKQRESSMQRSFEDTDFKTFVLSDSLAARALALQQTLDCRRQSSTGSARLVRALRCSRLPAVLIYIRRGDEV
ncbi:MAG TPA: hypothetical protein VJW17_07710 [Pyrinomonadaceae bacterium]|nr:hypothetical protein [Pyrinomonadaceae bacterium]